MNLMLPYLHAPRVVYFVALLSLCTGCMSGLRGPTSGQIGCPRQEVEISDKHMGLTSSTWTAACRGKTFYCSSHSSGDSGSQVSCKEAGGESQVAQTSGCQYDSQCKGDRICVDGACVAP